MLLTVYEPSSYDRSLMPMRLQRIIALFTAIAVLAVSFNCVCAGMTQSADAPPMPCCANHHHGQHCKYHSSHSSPCPASCGHCTQSAMNDTVANPSHHVVQNWAPLDALAAPLKLLDSLNLAARSGSVDTPGLAPPSTASTLLSLHCALVL